MFLYILNPASSTLPELECVCVHASSGSVSSSALLWQQWCHISRRKPGIHAVRAGHLSNYWQSTTAELLCVWGREREREMSWHVYTRQRDGSENNVRVTQMIVTRFWDRCCQHVPTNQLTSYLTVSRCTLFQKILIVPSTLHEGQLCNIGLIEMSHAYIPRAQSTNNVMPYDYITYTVITQTFPP